MDKLGMNDKYLLKEIGCRVEAASKFKFGWINGSKIQQTKNRIKRTFVGI